VNLIVAERVFFFAESKHYTIHCNVAHEEVYTQAQCFVRTAAGWTAGVRFLERPGIFSLPKRPDRIWTQSSLPPSE